MIKVQSCLPAYQHGITLLARSLGLAADVSERRLFVQRGNCAESSFSAGLVLPSAAEGAPRGPQPLTLSKEFALSDGTGLPCATHWKGGRFSWKCF